MGKAIGTRGEGVSPPDRTQPTGNLNHGLRQKGDERGKILTFRGKSYKIKYGWHPTQNT